MAKKDIKILIVDDVPKNIQVVATQLQKAGYSISFAQSGQGAIELCHNENFDLILLDIMMPEMDGFEVCRHLKAEKQFEDLPIIFLTAKSDTDSISKAFEVGGVDYLTKPFKSEELLARVYTHVTLKKQKEELKELNATKDKFFSIIAHDLRSPFAGLLGFTELLLEESRTTDPNQLKHYIKLMHQSAKQGFDLLMNLLEWSRANTGRISFSPTYLGLRKSVTETAILLSNTAEKKHIAIDNKVPEKLKVFADANMLKTVIRNLVSNAIKFTPEKGRIYIDAEKLPDGMVKVGVHDTGIGIPAQKIDKLFQIDKNVSTKGTANETGTGLGLLLCEEFTEQNNGVISVESTEGQGTSFYFTVPEYQSE